MLRREPRSKLGNPAENPLLGATYLDLPSLKRKKGNSGMGFLALTL